MRQLKITQQITSRETISLGKYFAEITPLKQITGPEEVELARKIAQGDQKALHKLIESNLRFVISVAKQYHTTGESLDELISAGNLGLIESAKRFDETRGFKFISYAVWWIRQSINQHLSENNKTIRIPLNKIGILSKIKNVQSDLEQIHERQPTAEEISIAISEKYESYVSEKTVREMMNSSYATSSLDAPLTSDNAESGTLNDIVAGEEYDDFNSSLRRNDLKIKIRSVLQRLSVNEKKVVTLYFGLEGEEKALSEIGKSMDLTAERVRQIKDKAIRRLKHSRINEGLIEYLN